MRRISTTTGLTVDASHVLYKTLLVLSEPERGATMLVFRTAMRRMASWRTKIAISRLELVSTPPRLVTKTKSLMMSVDQQ